MNILTNCFISSAVLGAAIFCSASPSAAQDSENAAPAQDTTAVIDCAADPAYKQVADMYIRHASKNLINKKLRMYGGGKKFKVKIYRCEAFALIKGDKAHFQTIDASYELSWKKKKFMGGKKYFLDLDSVIETDGSLASFNLIEGSHTLNPDFIRAFPLEIQYFNAYK